MGNYRNSFPAAGGENSVMEQNWLWSRDPTAAQVLGVHDGVVVKQSVLNFSGVLFFLSVQSVLVKNWQPVWLSCLKGVVLTHHE